MALGAFLAGMTMKDRSNVADHEAAHAATWKDAGKKDAVVQVGGGRGFLLMRPKGSPFVVTAAHCLPHLPPPHPWSYEEERTYGALLGPVNETPTITAT